jgi:hypothetical protein
VLGDAAEIEQQVQPDDVAAFAVQVAAAIQAVVKPPRQRLAPQRGRRPHPAQAGLDRRRRVSIHVREERGVAIWVTLGEVIRVGQALLDTAVRVALLDHVHAPAQDEKALIGSGDCLRVPHQGLAPARLPAAMMTARFRVIIRFRVHASGSQGERSDCCLKKIGRAAGHRAACSHTSPTGRHFRLLALWQPPPWIAAIEVHRVAGQRIGPPTQRGSQNTADQVPRGPQSYQEGRQPAQPQLDALRRAKRSDRLVQIHHPLRVLGVTMARLTQPH